MGFAPKRPIAPDVDEQRRAADILRLLDEAYPGARTELRHNNPFQLLVATILSAQCTDERVNMVTPGLFSRYPDAAAFAAADITELEEQIRSTGFFRMKARSIVGCCRALAGKHGGSVPSVMEELVALPGVGRKTANVVLGQAFGLATGVVVDTHVLRLSRRLGFTRQLQPEKIEEDLMALFPPKDWIALGSVLILHGRRVCGARKPRCAVCSLEVLCPSAHQFLPRRS